MNNTLHYIHHLQISYLMVDGEDENEDDEPEDPHHGMIPRALQIMQEDRSINSGWCIVVVHRNRSPRTTSQWQGQDGLAWLRSSFC